MTSRRRFLGLAAGAGVGLAVPIGAATYAAVTGSKTGTLLTSSLPLPKPFTGALPIPPRAQPVRSAASADYYRLTQREAAVEILPGTKTKVWGYDGIFPGPTFVGRSGRTMVVEVSNKLSVPTSMHLHGGVTPSDSDGYPTDLLIPVQCGAALRSGAYQGHSGSHGMHVPSGDWKVSEGYKSYEYPLHQRAATLWYHDHRMDFSAPQVWRGLAGMFLVHDDEEEALPLPKGDKDIPLMLCDRAFEADGSFRYPAVSPSCVGTPGVDQAYMDGVLGDVQLVNGAPWPVLEVANTKYRLRLLNASNARRYQLKLETDQCHALRFVQIGSDAGLLSAPQHLDAVPMAPAERFDVVVDFSACPVDTEVLLVNTLADGGMRNVMRFRVTRKEKDDSRIPARLAKDIPLERSASVPVRHFDFRRTNGPGETAMWTINGRPFNSSEVLASPRLGSVERWRFSSDFHHPVHLHLAHFQVLSRGGKQPAASDAGWKDTVDVRPYEVVEVLARFDGYKGRYMIHCHNLEHEDMAMMANFQVV
ncbi:multicopper oxidase family protein [Streptomyces violascens]|uniref:Multicopper oxidase CueO n=1 Tax=Streptomyces violascens TaxID=67381 RepID=A0ABQ3QRY5_9ACTN|nr:multicopper oxidase domain-containing protein [Streptomyces violascens]GGT84779.1 spore coat protein A [Streptomyces violascens]GHI40004.1 spore coat protein A [Streptomyces violascens]